MHRADMKPCVTKQRTWSDHSSTDASSAGDSSPFAMPSTSRSVLSLADLVVTKDDDVRANTIRKKTPTVSFADPATWPDGLTRSMMAALLRLAKETNAKLVDEAEASLQTPMKRNDAKLESFYNGIELYETRSPSPPFVRSASAPVESEEPQDDQHHHHKEPKRSLPRCLWNRLTQRRKRPTASGYSSSYDLAPCYPSSFDLEPHSPSTAPPQPSSHPPPRLFGLTQVRIPLDELLDVVGHRSPHAATLLHPGMRQTGASHTLVDGENQHVCLRSMTLPASLTKTVAAPRDFLLIEYHQSFTTSTGRRGYAVVCHSVHWARSPSPSEGTVRGSMYESGLVAIESASDPYRVDLYCVGEVNLKGEAEDTDNFEASRHRVTGTLKRIKQTVDERAKMLQSLSCNDPADACRQPRRSPVGSPPKQICSGCKDRVAKLPPGIEPYVCRSCDATVCGNCSTIRQTGHQKRRLCLACWADETHHRM